MKVKYLSIIAVALVISSAIVLSTGKVASADNRGPKNNGEWDAYNRCWNLAGYTGSAGSVRGAIWFTGAGDPNYWGEQVNVSATATSGRVELNGSAYGCWAGNASTQIWAINVSGPCLSNFNSTSLYRGDFPYPTYRNWDTQGGSIYADLSIPCLGSVPAGTTQTFYINLYRCFSTDGSTVAGSCYASNVPIHIHRDAPPTWTVGGSTSVTAPSAGATSIVEGTGAITWDNRIWNNGPDALDKTISVRVQRSYNGGGSWSDIVGPGNIGGNGTPPGNTIWNNTTSFSPGASDAGKRICERIGYSYKAWNDSGSPWQGANTGYSGAKCVFVNPQWYISGSSTSNVSSIVEGTTPITWTHAVNAAAYSYVSQTIWERIDRSYDGGATWTTVQGGAPIAGSSGHGSGNLTTLTTSYTPVATDSGKYVCEKIGYQWTAYNNGALSFSAPQCVFVKPQWFISGNTNDSSAVIPEGGIINWQHTVSATAYTYVDQRIWQRVDQSTDGGSTWTTVEGGQAIDGTHGNINTVGLDNGDSLNHGTGTLFQINRSYQTSAADFGKTICQRIGYQWTAYNNGALSFSGGTQCTIVGKQPKLSVTGGDVHTGDISAAFPGGNPADAGVDAGQTDLTASGGQFYGSWVEYGTLTTGQNFNATFGSGATLRGGSPALGAQGTNPLTFQNSHLNGSTPTNGPPYGQFGDTSLNQINPMYAFMAANSLNIPSGGALPASSPGSPIPISSLNGDYTANGDIWIGGGNVGAQHSIQIRDTAGTVTIVGDIKYNSTAISGQPTNIQQVIIVAPNINIQSNVDLIDAQLITNGLLDTCSDVASYGGVNSNTCTNQLTINGIVVGKTARFKRTYGSDTTASNAYPSENMNLPTDSYVWEYTQAAVKAPLTTVQLNQLPVRY